MSAADAESGSSPPSEDQAPSPTSERAPRRRRSRAGFATTIARITMLLHLPVAIAWTELFRLAHAPYPWVFGGVSAALAVLPLRGRMLGMMSDRPKPALERLLVDEPYFIHWCAAFGSAIPIALLVLVTPFVDLARGVPVHVPTAGALYLYAFFFAFAAYGVLYRRRAVVLRDVDVFVRDLPDAFDGYRVAQLSDLHIGGQTPRARAQGWVQMSNATKPDLVTVTGDLVTSGTAFHDDIALTLSELSSKDGTIVSMGNHDYFGEGDPLVDKLRDKGVTVLRNDSMVIERDGQTLRIAAVDDTWTGRADMERTLAKRSHNETTLVLAHDPDLFERAASLGADVVLSGHTHAGQIALPFFVRRVNLSRLAHARTYGIYTEGDSTLYVHAGLGTTGPPIRLGAAPEVVVLRLRKR